MQRSVTPGGTIETASLGSVAKGAISPRLTSMAATTLSRGCVVRTVKTTSAGFPDRGRPPSLPTTAMESTTIEPCVSAGAAGGAG